MRRGGGGGCCCGGGDESGSDSDAFAGRVSGKSGRIGDLGVGGRKRGGVAAAVGGLESVTHAGGRGSHPRRETARLMAQVGRDLGFLGFGGSVGSRLMRSPKLRL